MHELLVPVIESDGAELQQVNTDVWLTAEHVAAVLAAAPRLQVLNASVIGHQCAELLPVLRNEPPYGRLRVVALYVLSGGADVIPLAAALAAHESLQELIIENVHAAREVNALVDAATERRITQLVMHDCVTDAETVTALARLFQRDSLTKLDVTAGGFPRAQEESMPGLCTALRACRSLTHLTLCLLPPNNANHRTVTELLDAVAALPALSVLDLWGGIVQDTTAFGHALGALLRANLPSLRTLNVEDCRLGDEGLAPLLDGLAANTHLRELVCVADNLSSVAFLFERLTPALVALAARRELAA
jgi:hypothetical protein